MKNFFSADFSSSTKKINKIVRQIKLITASQLLIGYSQSASLLDLAKKQS